MVALADSEIEFEFRGPSIWNSQEVGLHADRRPSWPHKRINCSATFKRAQKRLAGICAKINYQTHPIFGRPIHHDVGGVFGTKVWIVPHLRANAARRKYCRLERKPLFVDMYLPRCLFSITTTDCAVSRGEVQEDTSPPRACGPCCGSPECRSRTAGSTRLAPSPST